MNCSVMDLIFVLLSNRIYSDGCRFWFQSRDVGAVDDDATDATAAVVVSTTAAVIVECLCVLVTSVHCSID